MREFSDMVAKAVMLVLIAVVLIIGGLELYNDFEVRPSEQKVHEKECKQ